MGGGQWAVGFLQTNTRALHLLPPARSGCGRWLQIITNSVSSSTLILKMPPVQILPTSDENAASHSIAVVPFPKKGLSWPAPVGVSAAGPASRAPSTFLLSPGHVLGFCQARGHPAIWSCD